MQVIFMISLFILFLFFLLAPYTVFTAAQAGLNLWWNTLVPSLLPFFILNELLVATGGVALLGRFLKRPVERGLKLPGEAAFVLITGYTTGVPVSAALIATLRQQNVLTKSQAQRLLPLAANVSPVFILSAVAVSLLHFPSCGRYLAFYHYGSNLILLLLVSLFMPKCIPPQLNEVTTKPQVQTASIHLLTSAIFSGVKTIILIGGLLLIFFILIAFCTTFHIPEVVCTCLSLPTTATAAVNSLFNGILEITAGAQAVAVSPLPLETKISLLSTLLAFGGISGLMQVKAQLKATDISILPYFFCKIIQGVLALGLSLLFPMKNTEAAVLSDYIQTAPEALNYYFPSNILYVLAVLAAISLLCRHLYFAER